MLLAAGGGLWYNNAR